MLETPTQLTLFVHIYTTLSPIAYLNNILQKSNLHYSIVKIGPANEIDTNYGKPVLTSCSVMYIYYFLNGVTV